MGEFIALLLVIFFSALGAMLLWRIFEAVRSSIKKSKKKYDEDLFERMANAFIKHKKDTERRLQNIETVIAGDDEQTRAPLKKSQNEPIEIDEPDVKENNRNQASKLPNHLRSNQ